MASEAEIREDDATRAAMDARVRTTFIAVAVMAGTMAFVAWEFAGVVPPALLYGWTGYMAAVDAGLLLSLLLSAMPWSPIRWPVTRWARFSRVFSIGFSVGVVVGVWVLLPPAGPERSGSFRRTSCRVRCCNS